jgi:hypothetical protein
MSDCRVDDRAKPAGRVAGLGVLTSAIVWLMNGGGSGMFDPVPYCDTKS